MSTPMKLFAFVAASVLMAAPAAAQSPTIPPAPERAPAGLNLNLKLDDAARRSIASQPAADQRIPAKKEGPLPSLGAESKRSFDPAPGSRPRSGTGSGPFPATVDTP
jgi:hypothetical protein